MTKGWVTFDPEPLLSKWVSEILPIAEALAADLELQRDWLRCGATWFAGVNVLPNDGTGVLGQSGPLAGQAIDFIRNCLGFDEFEFDHGQVSVCYPGYPKKDAAESEANHRYRSDRDAAHVDGLLREGEKRRRYLREFHGFILGLPLVTAPKQAAPFVIWEGSHKIMQDAFQKAFDGCPEDSWPDIDVTDIYHEARRKVWATCPRIELPARQGHAYIAHRLSLHGVAPWPQELEGPRVGRMVVYFRPDVEIGPKAWLSAP